MPRYPVDTEATVVMVNHGSSLRGRIVELSLDGCRLRADRFCALAAPASIEVMFKLNGMDFRLGGTMQWAEPRQTAGIQFSPMASRRRDFLVELLAELERKQEPKAGEAPACEENQPLPPAPNDPGEQPLKPAVPLLPAPPPAGVPAQPPAPPPPPGHAGRERRVEKRHAVDSRATILLVDVRARIAGRILDVSLSGCRIHTDERFPVGIYRRVETEFTIDGLPFRLGGVVQSLHDKFTVGVRFLDMSMRKREQLFEVIAEFDQTANQG